MKRTFRNLFSGIVAGIIVSCGGPVAREAALFIQEADAGRTHTEAGRRAEAGRPVEAGRYSEASSHPSRDGYGEDTGHGGILRDAARVLKDASNEMTREASAQSCASCSPGGAVRVTTADSDAAQIMSGYETNDTTQGAWSERVAGPFVVTSLIAARTGGDALIGIAYADPGGCASARIQLAQVQIGVQWESIQNGRFLVPKGKVLCVSPPTFNATASPFYVDYSWSGFKPYG